MDVLLKFPLALVFLISPMAIDGQTSPPTRFPVEIRGKWGFIDRTGSLAIPANFTASRDFYDGLAAVEVHGRWGFIDEAGRFLVNPKFEDVKDFDSGFAAVKKNNLWGFIDRSGQSAMVPQFDEVRTFHNGNPPAVRRGHGHWQYVDDTRTRLSKTITDAPCGLLSEMAPRESLHSKWGFVDLRGQWAIPPRFEDAGCFSDERAFVKLGGKWGVIDPAGQLVVSPQFDDVTSFNEGLAVVDVGPMEGMIRTDGSWLLWPQHRAIGVMSESRVSFRDIRSGWRQGFLDENGFVVIDIQFNRVHEFRGGLAWVETDDGIGYIDRDGKYVWPPSK